MMMDKSRPKTRKDRIMDAALRIFAEKGFQNTTITEISKAAGVSEATIYEYFGTKEDLLFAIPEKVSNETLEEIIKSHTIYQRSGRKNQSYSAFLCPALPIQSQLLGAGFAAINVQ